MTTGTGSLLRSGKIKNCHLSHDIKLFCRQLDNSNKEKKKLDYGEDSLDLGMLSVPV